MIPDTGPVILIDFFFEIFLPVDWISPLETLLHRE